MDGAVPPLLTGRVLHAGAALRVGHLVARPVNDAMVDVQAPSENVLALPLAGLFARHGRAHRPSIATSSHAVFFPAGQAYRISFPGAVGDEVLTLQWTPAALENAVPGARLHECQVLLDPSQVLGRGMLWRRFARGQADPLEVESLALALLTTCMGTRQGTQSRPRARPGGRDRVDRVRQAVAAAPEHKWTLTELAGIASVSPHHLAHVFRDEIGIPVHAYVMRARLSKALSAVLESDAGITDIAIEAGFASHSHFTARFREQFGITPAALRRREGRAVAKFATP